MHRHSPQPDHLCHYSLCPPGGDAHVHLLADDIQMYIFYEHAGEDRGANAHATRYANDGGCRTDAFEGEK